MANITLREKLTVFKRKDRFLMLFFFISRPDEQMERKLVFIEIKKKKTAVSSYKVSLTATEKRAYLGVTSFVLY